MDRGCDIRFRKNSSFSFSILKGNGTGGGRDIFEPGSQVLDGRVAGQLLSELVDSLRGLVLVLVDVALEQAALPCQHLPQVLVLLIHLLPQLLTSFSSCAAASAARGHYLFFPNIAKGTTDPRVEFILSKLLLQVISQVQTQILNQNQNQNLD